jgi:hypothetical protein
MAMLERSREEHAQVTRDVLELRPVVAEADDHGPRVDARKRLEQHVHALVAQELPEVDNCRLVAREELAEPPGIPLVRETLARVPGVRRVVARLLDEGDQCLLARLRTPLLDVDARRDLVDSLDVAADLLHHLADVGRPDERRARACKHLSPPRLELRTPPHRVLELRAVGLHGVVSARARPDRSAEQYVVAEEHVGRQMLAHRGRVGLHPCVELGTTAVLQQLDPVALVPVEHECGK